MQTKPFLVVCEKMGRKAKYKVYFQVNDQLIDRIKNLPKEQRIFNTYEKCWEITTKGLYKIIKIYKGSDKIHFEFDDRAVFLKQIQKIDKEEKEHQRLLIQLELSKKVWLKFKQDLDKKFHEYREVVHRELKKGVKLYPHQVTATMFINKVRNTLLSHDMGLGKTLASIAYVEMNGFEKVFVITPNSLKFNYYDEVNKFTNGSKAHIINWKKNRYTIEESKYIIVNYEYFNPSDKKKMDKKFKALGIDTIDCLICDESHRLKNTKSNTYKNFSRIFKNKIFRNGKVSKIFMTGTPAPNKAQELYTVLNQVSPLDFPNKTFFYNNYLGMEYDPDAYGGWAKNPSMEDLEALYHKIEPFTHRKKKKEVLTDLPDKIFQKIMVEMDSKDQAIYNDIEQGIANEFINEEIENPLTKILRLRQFTASLKAHVVKEFIDRLLDEGEKVVIMDYFKESLNELKKHYKDIAGLHTGDVSVEDRAAIVKEFQNPNGKIKIFLGSIQTCNYGLTLTAASRIFIISLPYSVGELDQAMDRLHRIGQKDVVNAYAVIFYDSVDEYVFWAIERKRREINKVIDNEDYESDVSESVIGEVIAKIKSKYGRIVV
jgi:SNF2 family DNA or RNA helicase